MIQQYLLNFWIKIQFKYLYVLMCFVFVRLFE